MFPLSSRQLYQQCAAGALVPCDSAVTAHTASYLRENIKFLRDEQKEYLGPIVSAARLYSSGILVGKFPTMRA